MTNIGDRIKERREALNLSQYELAQKVGYKSRSSINKIELGKTDISQSKLQEIADVLETTPAYLMGWEEEEKIADILYDTYLSADYQIIIEKCKNLDPKRVKRLIRYIDLLLEEEKEGE